MLENLKYRFNLFKYKFLNPNFPRATFCFIASFVFIWFLEILTGDVLIEWGALIKIYAPFQPWRYFTSIFLHSTTAMFIAGFPSPIHLILNCYSMWIIGRILENFLGHLRLVAIVFICGAGSSILATFVSFVSFTLGLPFFSFSSSIGASGSIMGMMVILFFLMKKLNLPIYQLGVLIGINIVLPMFSSGIDWVGHLSGAFVGLIVAFACGFLKPNEEFVDIKKNFRLLLIIASAACLVMELCSLGLALNLYDQIFYNVEQPSVEI